MNKTGTIFDFIDSPAPEGQEGYLEIAKNAPEPKDKSFLNDIADYSKTLLKGGIEGISRLGTIMGPLQHTGKPRQQQLEEQTETLDYLLPTDEGYTQKSLRRGAGMIPEVVASIPGSALGAVPRAIGAGFLGQAAEELDAPEIVQAMAEITAFVGPDITKKLIESGKNGELIKAAKALGMTDEQIAPLLQSQGKQKWLSKLASKTGAAQETLKETKSGLSQAYSKIQQSPAAQQVISQADERTLLQSLGTIAQKMPAAVRNKIKEDMMDLIKKPITGESLMNLWTDINHYLGENAKQLSLFKKPIRDAIASSSPSLVKDFDLINDMYSKYYKISAKLKPGIADQVIKAAEVIGIGSGAIKGFFFGDYSWLIGTLGEAGARKIAKEMLLNPRYQQLGQKMAIALNQNKYPLALKTIDEMKKELEKLSPDAAKELQPMTLEEFEKLSNPRSSKQK